MNAKGAHKAHIETNKVHIEANKVEEKRTSMDKVTKEFNLEHVKKEHTRKKVNQERDPRKMKELHLHQVADRGRKMRF